MRIWLTFKKSAMLERKKIEELTPSSILRWFEEFIELTLNEKRLRIINVFFLLVFGAILSVIVWSRPGYHWDMIPYAAVTLDDGSTSAHELHARAWSSVESHVPERWLVELRGEKGSFRDVQYRDPDKFVTMLPLYEVKLGYVLTLKAMSQFADPIQAIKIVNIISLWIIIGTIFASSIYINGIMRFVWLPILGSLDFINMIRFESPDAMSIALSVAGALFICRGRLLFGAILLIACLVTRPDNIFLCIATGGAFLLFSPRLGLILLVASAVAYFSVSEFVGHIGWWRHFNYTLVETPDTLQGYFPPFSISLYVGTLANNLAFLLAKLTWPYTVLLLILVLMMVRGRGVGDFFVVLAISAFMGFIAKFIVFPFPTMRLYAPNIYMIALILVYSINEYRKDRDIDVGPLRE